MDFRKIAGLIIILLITTTQLWATHNRAGEITYEQIGPLTIRITITTYTKTSSSAADRDSLEVFWGDGSREWVRRSNGTGSPLPNDVKVNKYIADHTYPGRDTYTVYFQDPNRVANILNVNFPNSVDVQFSLSMTFTFLDPQFQGNNNSAVLLQPPLDIACVGRIFTHNPNAYDPDGDSLAYELITPLEGPDSPVPGYVLPDRILPGLNNRLTLNPITGDLIWDSPQVQGEFNIAILVKEYRRGRLINTIVRDMQILVRNCASVPPIVDAPTEICVIAGEWIDLNIPISDPDVGQRITTTALGGPFLLSRSPAQFIAPAGPTVGPYNVRFQWQTTCDHISAQYYQVVIRAIDDSFIDGSGLATLRTIRIKVVGPPPRELEATSDKTKIILTWEKPYDCEVTESNYFRGFSVWRKITSTTLPPDTCNPGLSGSPYQRIIFQTTESDQLGYFAFDENVENGITYCYRVQAEFARLTTSGNPFNRVESMPSEESCVQLLRDLPLLTKASVTITSATDGEIHVRYIKPLLSDFDTLANPGPYGFSLERSTDAQNFTPIPTSEQSITSLLDPINEDFFDTNINTGAQQYTYRVALRTGTDQILYGQSSTAQSIFLNLLPSDRNIFLEWSAVTPWGNYRYEIFRKAENELDFTLLTTITDNANTYRDLTVENGKSYCYYVRSTGTYSLSDVEDPIFNDSQESCGIPNDNIPPCAPAITLSNICENLNNIDGRDLFNLIQWTDPNTNNCPIFETVAEYKVYFAENESGPYSVIQTQGPNQAFEYRHFATEDGLSGCYYVTASDPNGNESPPSNIICADNCPLYILPNTFTPNGDGANDIFKPIKNFFIARVDFKVYNEWGNLVFETTNPELNWDGIATNGSSVSDGTYYYVCKVFQNKLEGVVEQKPLLRGFIQVFR